MRAAIILAVLVAPVLVAPVLVAPALADPPPRPPRTAPLPHRPRTILVKLDDARPVIIVDAQQLPTVHLQPLARTPPPRCKKDRRGITRCRVTY